MAHPQILPCTDPLATITQHLRTPPQRLQSILSTHAPLTLLVPSRAPSPELSAALRIAHALLLFHALDAQIVSVSEVEHDAPLGLHSGNLVVIGCAETPLVQRWLERTGGIWTYADGAWRLGAVRFERPSLGEASCFAWLSLPASLTSLISRATVFPPSSARPGSDPVLPTTPLRRPKYRALRPIDRCTRPRTRRPAFPNPHRRALARLARRRRSCRHDRRRRRAGRRVRLSFPFVLPAGRYSPHAFVH